MSVTQTLCSEEAEQALLGCILLAPAEESYLLDEIPPEAFYLVRHQLIWRALAACHQRGALDLLLLTEQLERTGDLANAGGAAYLASLPNTVASVLHAPEYAARLTDYALRRALLQLAAELARLAHTDQPAAQLLEQVGQQFTALTRRFLTGRTAQPLAALLPALQAELTALKNGQTPPGLPTGIADLDRLTGGLFPGDLSLVAARPGVGKTTFLNTLARHLLRRPAHVLYCSLEMSAGQLLRRLLAAETGVDAAHLRSGPLADAEWQRLQEGLLRLAPYPLWLDDTPGATLAHLRATARQLAGRVGLDLILVDYLQLISPGAPLRSRTEEIGYLTAQLKQLARELALPVVVAAQLNRALEYRSDKTPTLADLREGGSQEQDADLVLFLHRPGLYDETQPPTLTDLILAKHRHGPTGRVQVILRPACQEFAGAARAEVTDG